MTKMSGRASAASPPPPPFLFAPSIYAQLLPSAAV